MKRMLLTTGAAAVAAMLMSGAASASPTYGQIVAPPVVSAPVRAASAAGWHYEWQYNYNKWDEYRTGWVAVPNNVQ